MPSLLARITFQKPSSRTFTRGLAAVWRLVVFWHSRARQRRFLSKLDERLLGDIGIDRHAARHESAKRFWQ
ncbi:MAG: DUF1127 domain-containing protein [Alphaproteobacteria bacterium]|nr:DUF1127 domain-containing protein [Alphaproteobacteria bacterium]